MSDIGKINLDFQVIDSDDPKTLLVADFSAWKIIKQLPSYIEITLPGSKKPIIRSFNKEKINGFNSLSLGLSNHIDCEKNTHDLPDGIYSICIRGGKEGQETSHRYYLKKDRFQNELDKAWLKIGLEYSVFDEEIRNALFIIEGLIRAATAATREGQIPKAKDSFKLAQSRIEAYKECKNCI